MYISVSGEDSMRAMMLSSLTSKLVPSDAEVRDVRRRLSLFFFRVLSLFSSVPAQIHTVERDYGPYSLDTVKHLLGGR